MRLQQRTAWAGRPIAPTLASSVLSTMKPLYRLLRRFPSDAVRVVISSASCHGCGLTKACSHEKGHRP